MDKSTGQIGVSPLTKISPVTAVAGIGTPAQAMESRADHLAKQHAGMLAKIAGGDITPLVAKSVSTASVSNTAKLIDQSLKQAHANGVGDKFIAPTTITHNPKIPEIVAQQLKAAISNSGLFYESHLKAFVEGQQHLHAIKQSPQNQSPQMAQSLLPQQLHILEHQRLSWHGEVWPGQKMDWEIYTQNKQQEKDAPAQTLNEATDIASDLTLHLPKLGKVCAKISVKNGHFHIGILAAQKEALSLLKTESPALASAIENTGQKLEGLTIQSFKHQEQVSNNRMLSQHAEAVQHEPL